jgi:hypothetical protein
MVQLPRIFLVAAVLLGTASAQISEDALKSRITNVRYPPLAEAARVQGDVHLARNAGMLTVLSGHLVLVQTALESAKAFASIQSETNLDLTYHFVLVDTVTSVPTSMKVPRGNVFERAVLRLFGLKPEKVIVEYRCQEGVAPPNDLKIGCASVEIWINGRSFCIQTEAETLRASR